MNTRKVCGQLNVTPKMLRIYEQQREESRLKTAGKEEALSVLTSEHYLFLDQLKEYLRYKNCSLEFSQAAENVGCFILQKAATTGDPHRSRCPR